MRVSRRTAAILLVAAAGSAAAAGVASALLPELMGTRVAPWRALRVEQREGNEQRVYFRAPTSTLLHLGLVATTLAPGATPHPVRPHSRPIESVIIVKEGTLEVQIDKKRERLDAGSALFLGPNQWHAVRNPGRGPVTYYEMEWVSPGMNGEPGAAAMPPPVPVYPRPRPGAQTPG